jgi:Mitochondrial K+-H+ exchange-related
MSTAIGPSLPLRPRRTPAPPHPRTLAPSHFDIVSLMDVFVIPVGADQYVLYYEQPVEPEPEDEPAPTGMFARLQRRFGELLRAAEEHRHERTDQAGTSQSWTGRIQDRMMSWIAKRVAEQRLLWNLRKQEHVVAVHPGDTTFSAVTPHIHQALQRDYERHRNWLIIDTIGLVVSGLLAIVPGPNLLAYYFLFRVGGHWLSMRGATQGRRRVEWEGRPCEPLDGLRDALRLPRRERHARVQQIASTLHLRHLPTFFERVTAKATTGDSGLGTRDSTWTND